MQSNLKTSPIKSAPIQKAIIPEHQPLHDTFHESAGTAKMNNPTPYDYSPFQAVKDVVVKGGEGLIKDAVKGIGKGVSKVAQTIMAPTVNAMKIHDAQMEQMSRDAKAGKFNQ